MVQKSLGVLCYPFVEVNSLTEHHLSFLFDGDYCFADYAHIKFNLSIVVSLRMTFVMKILKFVLGQYINFNALVKFVPPFSYFKRPWISFWRAT